MRKLVHARILLVVTVVSAFFGARSAQGNVDLELRPIAVPAKYALPDTVTVGLYMVSDSGSDQQVGTINAIVTWDPAFLTLTGKTDNGVAWTVSEFSDDSAGDNLNGSFADGNAFYGATIFPPQLPFNATPAGTLVTTLNFSAVAVTASTGLNIPATFGASSVTRVLNNFGGSNVTGTLSGGTVQIVQCLDDADCNDGNPCTGTGGGGFTDVCVAEVCNHTPNLNPTPNDGMFCNGVEQSCNANGTINYAPGGNPPNCADSLACTTDSCNESTDMCDHVVQAGICLISGVCYNEFDLNPASDCQWCRPAFGQTTWTNKSGGSVCGSQATTECSNPDQCNGAGVCSPQHLSNGTLCTADAFECTDDVCNTGACTHPNKVNGTACGDPADTTCTDPDTCQGGACATNNVSNGTVCDDSLYCTVTDQCQAGACVGTGSPCTPTPARPVCNEADDSCGECLVHAECLDANPCTADLCLLNTLTDQLECYNINNDQKDPEDGVYCNGVQICQGGFVVTQPGSIPNCEDGNPCTIGTCNRTTDSCDQAPQAADPSDGLRCNGIEVCTGGQVTIQENSVPNCADATVCTLDTCIEAGGGNFSCTHQNQVVSCSDGDNCTEGDVCQAGICMPGSEICDHVNIRLTPSAVTAFVGQMFSVELHVFTNAGQTQDISFVQTILNWDETKLALISKVDPCISATPCPKCASDEYNWLFSRFFNDSELDGLNAPFPPMPCDSDCQETFIPANDGDAFYECTVQLLCNFLPPIHAPLATATPLPGLHVTTFTFQALAATTSPTPIQIPAMQGSTTDSQVIGNQPGLIVTGTIGPDVLVTVNQCANASHCNDGNPCTLDGCSGGNCTHTPQAANPDDGLYCNGVDTCVAGVWVKPGSPCNDGNPCTDDTCNETTDTCGHIIDNSNLIDDGFFCNGIDTCVGGVAVPGALCPFLCDEVNNRCVECFENADCADGIFCTDDVCNTLSACGYGKCFHTPVDGDCDDGTFCNGFEFCDTVAGCISPGNPCPNPGSCDEGANNCGGCDHVLSVAGVGPRFLMVAPPAEQQPIAFLVIGDPSNSYIDCAAGYVQFDGSIGPTPFFQPVATWGAQVKIRGTGIYPSKILVGANSCNRCSFLVPSEYTVHVDCGMIGLPLLSAGRSAYTNLWGDVDSNCGVDNIDIIKVLNGFQGVFNPPLTKDHVNLTAGSGGLSTCLMNDNIDNSDIVQVLNAFQGQAFPCAGCP